MPRLSTHAAGLALPLAVLAGACRTPDPKAEVELRNVEGFFAVDPAVGETQYLAPVVRFQLHNKSATAHSIQATATLRRVGDPQSWSGSAIVSPVKGQPLPHGASALVVLKPEGEGRYTYKGSPTEMLQHPEFKDFTAEVFVKVGRSNWTKMADVKIERRLGSHTVDAFR